ncbi:MAG: UDP-N-acetylmuramate--alanine ligase [Leptonema sp. (in: Bacteria)]|nr:UDP-N-acetylmuramate--alanine ligase [Leptonema sp. (in: bacteria)]
MRIHLIGVGGAAMGNLAAMLKQDGHTITGSDQALYPPMSDRLIEWGIEAGEFDSKRIINNGKPQSDLFIVGNVISRGNVEVEEVLNHNLPLTSMSAALYQFFLQGRRVQVIAGTHGKTTTAFLLHHILDQAGLGPGLFVGGIRGDGHAGFSLPKSNFFVIEGDEYDTAFFDKGPKFLHYRPTDLVLTHVEYDHADIYEDFDHYKRSFELLLRWIPSNGNVAAFAGSSGVQSVMNKLPAGCISWYGPEGIANGAMLAEKSQNSRIVNRGYSTYRREAKRIFLSEIGNIEVPFIGEHNTANALGAALIAQRLGVAETKILDALSTFPGVLRRQQIRKKTIIVNQNSEPTEIVFIEDFAHHPTAVKLTYDAVKQAYPNSRIIGLFEPRSATSHRNTFQQDYLNSFTGFDQLFLTNIYNLEKVAADQRLNVPLLVESLNQVGTESHFSNSPKELFEQLCAYLSSNKKVPTVILAMSNGSFVGVYPQIDKFLDQLK